MSGDGWKLTLRSFATVAGISFATCLNAQEGKNCTCAKRQLL